MDELSRKILRILQKDARTSISEIAHKVGRPRTTVAQRIRKLEDNGVITSYRALIDPYKVGFRYHAVVMLKVRKGSKSFMSQIEIAKKIVNECASRTDLPFVDEALILTGGYDILMRIWVREWKDLSRFLLEYLPRIDEVASTETLMVLEKVPETPKSFPI